MIESQAVEEPKEQEPQTFREFSESLRQITRRGFVRVDKAGRRIRGTYVRPKAENEIRGKAAIKAAKREKVRQMKAAQATV